MNAYQRLAAAALTTGMAVTSFAVMSAPAHAGTAFTLRQGTCSGSSLTDLKVKRDNGRLEVEGEVDSNVNAQTWRWGLRHDGQRVFSGARFTRGPSGSFTVHRFIDNNAGADRIVFNARNIRSGEVCRTSMSF